MDWELRLITPYEFICKHYREHLWVYCQRFGTYADVSFTDEEVICIYLWGLMDKRHELKDIYKATDELIIYRLRFSRPVDSVSQCA